MSKIPDALLQPFLQHVRDFESRYTERMHMSAMITETNLSLEQVQSIFRSLRPPFELEFTKTFQ